MQNRRRLDELRLRLAAAGAPPDQIERLVGELEDHLDDAVRAQMGAGNSALEAHAIAMARLGPIEQVAYAAAARSRDGRLGAGIPRLLLVASPIVLLPLCWVAFLLFTVGLGALLMDWQGINARGTAARWYLRTIYALAQYGIPAALAATAYRAARSHWFGAAWAATAAAVALVAGSMLSLALRLPATAGDEGALVAGLSPAPEPLRLALTAVCVVVYLAIRRRSFWPVPTFS